MNFDSLQQRYAYAVRQTAQKIAAETLGVAVEGYWLDENRFYFLADRLEPSLGHIISIPSIADCEAQSVEEVIPPEALASLLSEHASRPMDWATLSSATFDMARRDTLAISTGGRDYLVDVQQRRIVASKASLKEPALYSPDGRYACFVRGHGLWLKERETELERPLTPEGAPHHCYGQQTETCSGAVSYRKRRCPMGLWSPDSQWFLTHQIDERSLPQLDLIQHSPPDGGRPILHCYKYSMPGDPLPVGTFVAIHADSGRIIRFDGYPAPVLGYSPFYYRMVWFSGRDRACFLRMDRYCKQAELIELNLADGIGRMVLSETVASGYLEFHQLGGATPNVRTLPAGGEVVWFSERDGWGHLYLYDAATGALKNRITAGEWLVRDIVHVDETERKILFTACGIDPLADPVRRSLCKVNLDGSAFEVLLAYDGDIALPRTEPCGLEQNRPFRPAYAQPGVSPGGRFGIVRYASLLRGNVTRMVDLNSRQGFDIVSALPVAGEMLPQPFIATAADGVTTLHGTLFFPSDFVAALSYPLVDYIYPGPQTMLQPQSYHSVNASHAAALAQLGFVTVMLDTRGMPFRSRALHQAGYGELLEPQLADHAAVMRQLCERHPFIDRERIGIFGASGGGAATARALFDYGAIFKVGVSVCGNHDNRFNIAFWSDKYRGPGDPESSAAQANGAAAHKLEGKLLLISGDMDENVHVSHTLALADALVRANRDFDLLIVPNEGHLLLMTSGYVQRRVWDYFVRHLLEQTPPQNFAIKFEPHEMSRMEKSWVWEWRS